MRGNSPFDEFSHTKFPEYPLVDRKPLDIRLQPSKGLPHEQETVLPLVSSSLVQLLLGLFKLSLHLLELFTQGSQAIIELGDGGLAGAGLGGPLLVLLAEGGQLRVDLLLELGDAGQCGQGVLVERRY